MVILDLKFRTNKKTCDVFLDDGQIINLTSESLMKYGIYKNSSVSEKDLLDAQKDSEKSKALDKSLSYLSKGYRSERQLKGYLREKKYPPYVQDYVIEKLKEYNYLNDEYLTSMFVQSSQKKMGINKIKQKLYEKGISKKIIDNSLSNIDDQSEICLSQCQKKWQSIMKSKPNSLDRAEEYKFYQNARGKLSRYLANQGFDWDTINTAMRKTVNYSEDN